MRKMSQHTEWLSLVEVSGPFLSTSVLEKIFPQGLEVPNTHVKQRLRSAYNEWRDAVEDNDPELNKLHRAWCELVLRELLEFDDSVFSSIHENEDFTYRSPDSNGRFTPDYAFRSGDGEKPTLLISIFPEGTDLEKVVVNDDWPVSIHERFTLLCRAKDIRLGLVTNGEQWMLINAPVGSTSSQVTWYAHLWFQEEVTIRAFQSLLGVRRWFGPKEQSLSAMLDESLKYHEEVTDTLGEQVRRAVEVLVQSLDKADQDRNRELLKYVSPAELYEAGLTVMMRLVFVLCAEERGLLLLGDPVYDQYYAVTTLRGKLAEESDRHGHEVLERRHDAWARLLAIFRAIYGGVEHETLRMPALGGSLFDPDRFPFLEGRAKGTSWQETPAQPLPIDNRTVLLLLDALQVLEQRGGALLLSYKALDVEQIGHVYEGLLEYTVQRINKDTLGLVGSQKIKHPNISLVELESARQNNEETIVSVVKEVTGRSETAIENALKKYVNDDMLGKILVACGGDMTLANRILPFARLMRTDGWDDFIVYRAGAFAVTHGADRRETGTHYTQKSLTESIVKTTLEPIVYTGPADGKPREEWQLKSSVELLDLKICDPAMGSGAFLVQVCRWLSERLVESWSKEEAEGKFIAVAGNALAEVGSEEPMPSSLDERLLIARRLIAERCLYGVDMNPLAVELAKLSIWLITLAKGRPFGFLDHNLRSGDSLLGIHKFEQLTKFSLHPEKKQTISLFASSIDVIVKEVITLRKKLREMPIRDIRDVQYMERLDKESRQKLKHLEHIADAIIGEALVCSGNEKTLEGRLDSLSDWATEYIKGDNETGKKIISEAMQALSVDLPDGKPTRKPFHWALEFPEVFEHGGFDGIVGNPPFMGGQKITGNFGTPLRDYLVLNLAFGKKGSADLCAYFFLRCGILLRNPGYMGLLATNTIAQGDTREVGLQQLLEKNFSIIRAISSQKWPGKANLEVAVVWLTNGKWNNECKLDQTFVKGITSHFTIVGELSGTPFKLDENKGKSFQGSIPLGSGFLLSFEEAERIVAKSPSHKEVIKPYIGGDDILSNSNQLPSRWVIDFGDMTLEEAKKFPYALEIIERLVRPEREKNKRRTRKERWWQFAETAKSLYESIKGLNTVLFHSFTSKYVAFAAVDSRCIFAGPHVVVAYSGYSAFAALQSSFHDIWARQWCSTHETRLRYAPSDLFETFPLPSLDLIDNEIGKNYYSLDGNTVQLLDIIQLPKFLT